MKLRLPMFLKSWLRSRLTSGASQLESNSSPNLSGTPLLDQGMTNSQQPGHSDLSLNSSMANPPKPPAPQTITPGQNCEHSIPSERRPNGILTHSQWMWLNERINQLVVQTQFSEALIKAALTKGPIV